MNVISMDNICFKRDGNAILQNVSWTVQPGEHWCILGANGSGKTTLLNMLSGYEWPSSGKVSFLGNLFGHCDLPAVRRRIGWVSSALEEKFLGHGHLRRSLSKEVVASGLVAGLKWYELWSDELESLTYNQLKHLNAESVADKPFQVLSQGERKRVLIARALINKPTLLVLDEPCSGLDPVSRQAFLSDISSIAQQSGGPTTVLVTHHVEEIGPWITHGLGLAGGSVTFAGRLKDVLQDENMENLYGQACSVEQHSEGYRLLLSENGT